MFGSYDLDDPIIICPYDRSHRIVRSRIQKHIVKCERNFPENYKEICPYNATHRLFKADMENHIKTCPMRTFLDPYLYQSTPKQGSIKTYVPSEMESIADTDETWEVDSHGNWPCNASVDTSIDNFIKPITFEEPLSSKNCKEVQLDESLRTPRGYSEALLRAEDEVSTIDDMESMISLVGIGRGKPRGKPRGINKKLHMFAAIGRGAPISGKEQNRK
ncbi:uncharacterized protein LOC105701027 [Orussus abietinus]|uniref:uncharacterized protein LOC105701027 n=1 Tax=Orussus abietinus TaxID=222816 RepID=UPI00062684BF|nr:uncharacterized protein LOC105701027 [Orussus abietinus]